MDNLNRKLKYLQKIIFISEENYELYIKDYNYNMDICRDWYFETLLIGDGERLIFSDKLLNEVFTRWVLKLKLEDKENFIRPSNKTT
jgi:hypothetical protein